MNQIEAPFTPEQVANLNAFQQSGRFHPFTCDLSSAGRSSRSECPDGEGVLIATENGWSCPCGQYVQNWAHEFMAEPLQPTVFDVLRRELGPYGNEIREYVEKGEEDLTPLAEGDK